MKIVIVADDLLGDEDTHQALLDAMATSGGVCRLDTGIERIQVRLEGLAEESLGSPGGDSALYWISPLEGA